MVGVVGVAGGLGKRLEWLFVEFRGVVEGWSECLIGF